MRRAFAAAALPLACAAACSSFGSSATPAADAGADASTVPFCKTFDVQPIFCTDFSEATVGDRWTAKTIKAPNATITNTTETFTSAPQALDVTLPAESANIFEMAVLGLQLTASELAPAKNGLEVRFMVREEATDVGRSAQPISVLSSSFGALYAQSLGYGVSNSQFGEFAKDDAGKAVALGGTDIAIVPVGEWRQVVVTTAYGAGAGVTIVVGDTTKSSSHAAALLATAPDSVVIELGVFGTTAGIQTPPLHYRFDDFAVLPR